MKEETQKDAAKRDEESGKEKAVSEQFITPSIYNGCRIWTFARLAQRNPFDFHHRHMCVGNSPIFQMRKMRLEKLSHMLQDIQLWDNSLRFGFSHSKPLLHSIALVWALQRKWRATHTGDLEICNTHSSTSRDWGENHSSVVYLLQSFLLTNTFPNQSITYLKLLLLHTPYPPPISFLHELTLSLSTLFSPPECQHHRTKDFCHLAIGSLALQCLAYK